MNLRPHLLREAEFRRSVYQVILEPGTVYEDILKPEFWSHVSRKLKVRDRIDVHAHDGSWYADLIVRSSGPVSTSVSEICRIDFPDAAPMASSDAVEIKWRGPTAKWSAIRRADKKVLTEGHDTREDVETWLKKPQQAQAA